MPSSKRAKILSNTEIEELYGLPIFTRPEKEQYFSLDPDALKALSKRTTIASKVHFVLQLGYFKATSQFFNVDFPACYNDIDYILQTYFPEERLSTKNVAKQTRHTNQHTILDLLGYSGDKLKIKQQIIVMLKDKILHCSDPVYLFHESMLHADQHKLMLLAYSTLQDLIGEAITHEEQRLTVLLQHNLSASAWSAIENLLKSNEDGYLLSALKKDPKSFKTKQITEEIKKQKMNHDLFKAAKSLLPKLELSQKNIQYYAQLAVHYPIHKLKLLSSSLRSVYILCFIYHRYHRISDNLMVSFFHYIEKYKADVKKAAREMLVDDKLEIVEDSKQAATVLRFFDDDDIPDIDQFGKVRKRAHKHIKKGQFTLVADYLDGILFDYQKTLWQKVFKLRYKIRNNLRPIFTSLDFFGVEDQCDLLKAVIFLKSYFSAPVNEKPGLLTDAPLSAIPAKWINNIWADKTTKNNDDQVDINKYEFMIYQIVADQIEAGHIYLPESVSFKNFSDYLIDNQRWKNKEAILKKLNNKALLTPFDTLMDQFEDDLEKKISSVNDRLKNGDCNGVKIKKEGDEITFTLPYPKHADKANHPVFGQIKQISIAEVLQFSQQNSDFMKVFTHIKPYNAKDSSDPIAIMACIIANATNLGIHKMAETSDLNYNRMQSQMRNFIRLDTLQEANDILSNAIAKLPIFKHWNIHNDGIHASVDGQKFETRLHSFIARYSSKYFGVNKGVVSYTLCANHVPVNVKIISANHHESHYLFDILFNNTSDMDIKWLSGDGHSINQINFALLDFIDKQFAPHFKKINKKIATLHGFKSLHKYDEMMLKPKQRIDKGSLRDEWDNIQRIIASLLLGESSQHLIVSKLSSYKRKNKTKEALWQYDKILMSLYLLNFIDDEQLRVNVRRALNRGEAYHQLRRAIANVHGRKFRGSSEREIQLWNECARLMTNCIIYYNTMILNYLLKSLENEGDTKLIDQLKYISPAAWQHINLYGYYTFEKSLSGIINTMEMAEGINMLNIG